MISIVAEICAKGRMGASVPVPERKCAYSGEADAKTMMMMGHVTHGNTLALKTMHARKEWEDREMGSVLRGSTAPPPSMRTAFRPKYV